MVVATWEKHAPEIEQLLAAVRDKPVQATFRALTPFQVNMFRTELARLSVGMVVPLSEDIDLLVWRGEYDPQIGRTSEFQNLLEAI